MGAVARFCAAMALTAGLLVGCSFEKSIDKTQRPDPVEFDAGGGMSDGGDDGGNGDGGQPVDQCANPDDREAALDSCYGPAPTGGEVMCTEQPRDQCRAITTLVGDCATGMCVTQLTTGTREEAIACVRECVLQQTGNDPGCDDCVPSIGCVDCIAQVAICSANECLSPCLADSMAPPCVRCQCQNGCIRGPVTECAGLPNPFCNPVGADEPITTCTSDADCEPDNPMSCSGDGECPDRQVCNSEGHCAERVCNDSGICSTRNPCNQ